MVKPGSFEITAGGLQPGVTSTTTECISKKMIVAGNPFVVE
jgi:hypothetical protein